MNFRFNLLFNMISKIVYNFFIFFINTQIKSLPEKSLQSCGHMDGSFASRSSQMPSVQYKFGTQVVKSWEVRFIVSTHLHRSPTDKYKFYKVFKGLFIPFNQLKMQMLSHLSI